ncbi:MAG TPA: efflux RND transporter periplasmic adaptor subunit [Telluria sp.]
MKKQHIAAIGAIAAFGVAAALFILRAAPGDAHDVQHDDHAPAATAAAAPPAGAIALTDEQIRAGAISLEPAAPRRLASSIHLLGEIHVNGERSVQVAARAGGMVETVPVSLGQQVRRGQVLAVLASAQVADLRSELHTFEQRLALARTTLARERALWEEKISAEQDYLAARQAQQEAANNVQNARQKLAGLGADTSGAGLARYQLRAPIAGTVIALQVAAGEAVAADKPLFTIADLSTVWLDVAVPAGALPGVAAGSTAQVRGTGVDAAVAATVAWVSAVAGAPSRTATARIVLPNPDGTWRPGLFASADVNASERAAPVSVSIQAVHAVDGQQVVFVRAPGGFVAQPVTTGVGDGRHIEILTGLRAGTVHAAANSNLVKSEQGKTDADHAH